MYFIMVHDGAGAPVVSDNGCVVVVVKHLIIIIIIIIIIITIFLNTIESL